MNLQWTVTLGFCATCVTSPRQRQRRRRDGNMTRSVRLETYKTKIVLGGTWYNKYSAITRQKYMT